MGFRRGANLVGLLWIGAWVLMLAEGTFDVRPASDSLQPVA